MTLQMPSRIWIASAAIPALLSGTPGSAQTRSAGPDQGYEYAETRELVTLVNDAASLIRSKGDAAFADFRVPGSRLHQEETDIFVLDRNGNMLVHPDTKRLSWPRSRSAAGMVRRQSSALASKEV